MADNTERKCKFCGNVIRMVSLEQISGRKSWFPCEVEGMTVVKTNGEHVFGYPKHRCVTGHEECHS
jgi:hypothetical protein